MSDQLPVRVWTGYALADFRDAERQQLYNKLGTIFMPLTVQLMQPYGLTAYLPAVVPSAASMQIPDEVALVFYESDSAYHDAATLSTGGRGYELLHQSLFNFSDEGAIPPSRSHFPDCYSAGEPLSDDCAYYARFEQLAWQQGSWQVQV